jgi:acylphosphatase
MIARRIIIRGRVQGVGFRFSMIDMARESNVVGWVRNRHDGAVEGFVQGDAAAVDRVINWSRRGPPGARVTDVESFDAPLDPALRDFSQRASG